MEKLVFTQEYEDLLMDCMVEMEGNAYDHVKEIVYTINDSNPDKVEYKDLIELGHHVIKVVEEDKKAGKLLSKLLIRMYIDNGFKTAKALIGNMSSATSNIRLRTELTEEIFDVHMKDQKSEREKDLYDLVTTFGLGKGF